MGEAKAYELFRSLRWPETDGDAVCPRCGCCDAYDIPSRRKFQCKACGHHFSVTSGTLFAGRKLAFTDLLAAIVLFVNGCGRSHGSAAEPPVGRILAAGSLNILRRRADNI
jgi:transposase-like protein